MIASVVEEKLEMARLGSDEGSPRQAGILRVIRRECLDCCFMTFVVQPVRNLRRAGIVPVELLSADRNDTLEAGKTPEEFLKRADAEDSSE